jgi:7-cyano-7-deazaguanine synthase
MNVQKELPGTSSVDGARPAVVVLSGGQDSMTCLAVAMARHSDVFTVSFDYGQRHAIELVQAALIAQRAGVPHRLVDVRSFGELVTSGLLNTNPADTEEVAKKHPLKPHLPASFVPNRNALFLTIAHAIAQEVGAGYLYTGVCQTDYSGYPDCRQAFVSMLEDTLNIGYETNIQIITPMMNVNKAETFAMAARLGVLHDVIELSHTCYNGNRDPHEWGAGCGHCPACTIRERGYHEFMAKYHTEDYAV